MAIKSQQYFGCLLGLALGDALGAPYEGGMMERLLWHLIGNTAGGAKRWTDDTQMALDLAGSLLEKGLLEQDHLIQRLATSYQWNRGYGSGTAKLLKQVKKGKEWSSVNKAIYAQGSYGNGAAVRAPIMALWCPTELEKLVHLTQVSAEVTHAHPLGMEGAVLIALATAQQLQLADIPSTLLACAPYIQQPAMHAVLTKAVTWLMTNSWPPPAIVAQELGNGMTATTSCVTAFYIALRFRHETFEGMLSFIRHLKGDVDSISAMAGAMWGAYNGMAHLPLVNLENDILLEQTASALYSHYLNI